MSGIIDDHACMSGINGGHPLYMYCGSVVAWHRCQVSTISAHVSWGSTVAANGCPGSTVTANYYIWDQQ